MVDPQFHFELEPVRGLLRITMTGFWDERTLKQYAIGRAEAVKDMEAAGCPESELRILVDRTAQVSLPEWSTTNWRLCLKALSEDRSKLQSGSARLHQLACSPIKARRSRGL